MIVELPLFIIFAISFSILYSESLFPDGLLYAFGLSTFIYTLIFLVFFIIQKKNKNGALCQLDNGKAKCVEALATGVNNKEDSWSLYGRFKFEYDHGCPDETCFKRLMEVERHTLLTTSNLQRENNVLWVNFYPNSHDSPVFQFSLYEVCNKNYNQYDKDIFSFSKVNRNDKKIIVKNFMSNMWIAIGIELFIFLGIFLVSKCEFYMPYVLGAMVALLAVTVLLYILLILRADQCRVAECTEVGNYTTSYNVRRKYDHHWVILKLENSDTIIGLKDPDYDSIYEISKYEKMRADIDTIQKNFKMMLDHIDDYIKEAEESSENMKDNSEDYKSTSEFITPEFLNNFPEYKKQILKIVFYKLPFGLGMGKLIFPK